MERFEDYLVIRNYGLQGPRSMGIRIHDGSIWGLLKFQTIGLVGRQIVLLGGVPDFRSPICEWNQHRDVGGIARILFAEDGS